ncbi:MAG TPA: ABC transporter ATP-binding protein [Pararhizobium sp.]|nr:ABC transporter ATP-binding protein [Pararhizobium sp.]
MIEIEAITKRYDGRPVVDEVSLVVDPHTLTVIVGTSGSGKTTLLRMINRLVEPSAGTIRIDGKDHRAVPPHILRRGIGYVIQGHGLFPHRTVGQNIATVPVLSGWDKPRIAGRVDELLTLFQLDPGEFRDRYPHQLSGGQKQRVGVARALAAKPNILLMDEPFGALDPVIRSKAQQDLLAIQKRLGTTIVLVTHDMEEAIQLGDKIAVMDGGKLLQYATPADILAKPATGFVETLVGTGDRPFRYLSLSEIGDIVEPGEADGEPLPVSASRRDALAELLWSGRAALPVTGEDGAVVGRVTRDVLMHQAARPGS